MGNYGSNLLLGEFASNTHEGKLKWSPVDLVELRARSGQQENRRSYLSADRLTEMRKMLKVNQNCEGDLFSVQHSTEQCGRRRKLPKVGRNL